MVENNHKIVTLVETPGRICCHAVMQLANIYFVWVGDEEGVRRETLGGVAHTTTARLTKGQGERASSKMNPL